MEIASVLQDYISIVALVICACAGYGIKNVIPNQDINRFIPIIVMVLGTVITVWAEGSFAPDVIARGMVSGLASSGAYEAIDQLRQLGYEKKIEGMATDPIDLDGPEGDDQ